MTKDKIMNRISIALLLLLIAAVSRSALAQGRSDLKFTATAVTFPEGKKVELKLRGTTRYSRTQGNAAIEYKDGLAKLTLSVKDLDPPSQRQYTTYVFWAVTPEGLTDNVGELRPRKTSVLRIFARAWGGTIETATRYRTFCIVMTAEPHFLVESPSREVVVASVPPDDKEGLETEPVEVNFRGDIGLESVPWREDRISTQRDRETPVELLEARRALDLGRYFQVEQHAEKEFKQAEELLEQAERAFDRGADDKAAVLARRAVIAVEVARRLARERRDAEQQRRKESALADLEDRVEQAEKELAEAKAQIGDLNRTLDAKGRELIETRTRVDELRAAVDRAERQVKELTQTERRLTEQLDSVTKQLADEQVRNKSLAEELSAIRQSSISLVEHRAKLALARIAETRDDGDSFVVVLPNDRLFAAGRRPPSGLPQLKPEGLATLDAIAGVLASYPLGDYTVEGHLVGQGTPERLQALSQANAAAVVAYLLSKSVPGDKLKPVGRGAEAPLVRGNTLSARRSNDRVEIVIRNR